MPVDLAAPYRKTDPVPRNWVRFAIRRWPKMRGFTVAIHFRCLNRKNNSLVRPTRWCTPELRAFTERTLYGVRNALRRHENEALASPQPFPITILTSTPPPNSPKAG